MQEKGDNKYMYIIAHVHFVAYNPRLLAHVSTHKSLYRVLTVRGNTD